MASNALHRFGANIAPFRWLGKEIAGVGARTGMQGKPMLSKPFRNLAAVGLDPQLTSLYENAHKAGRLMGPEAGAQLPSIVGQLQHNPAALEMLGAKNLRLLHDVPLQSIGIRKAIDYGFTPVSQVASDIRHGVGRLLLRHVEAPGQLLPAHS